MTEHEINVAMMKSDLDYNLKGLAERVNTQRMAELIVEAGVTKGTDLQSPLFLTAMFLANVEGLTQ